jgi:flagellar biosynthesis protein FlhB
MADSNKTEQATPRHRLKARQQGRVTRSRELTGAVSMVAVAGVISLTAEQAAHHWTDFFRNALDAASTGSMDVNGPVLFWTSVETLRWVLPILATAMAVSLAVGVAQGGFVFAPEALALKFDRLSPGTRLKQIFSLTGVTNTLKSLLPFAAIAWVGYASIASHWPQILASTYADPRAFVHLASEMLLEVCWKSGLILLGWSGIDYLALWLRNEGEMKMSKQEIREEMKETDGNPASKSRMRKLQRAARRKMMIKATETATVVITNPTHYAVALRYETNMPAPIVVAKGLDLLAAKIKEIARERSIPIMENKPLAQALYKGAEVGDAIPSALYHAVAEILVLVYKAEAEVRQREAQTRAAASRAAGGGPGQNAPGANGGGPNGAGPNRQGDVTQP